MKLFLDENLSPQHASELRTEGYDAIAVPEVGLAGATDEQVLRFAVENGRVLMTLDADFANVIRFPPANSRCCPAEGPSGNRGEDSPSDPPSLALPSQHRYGGAVGCRGRRKYPDQRIASRTLLQAVSFVFTGVTPQPTRLFPAR